jgi:2'-5' RNA ligase
MPRPNWFFAFPLDGDFLSALPESPPSLRRFHPADLHMTLAFLGGCGEAAAERALGVLDAELLRVGWASLAISLGEVVPLGGSRRDFTALSALLVDGRAEAARCLDELGGLLCESAILRRPSRPAKPHVTLARPRRRATDADRAAGLAWAKTLDLGHVRQTLTRVALYSWDELRRERLFRIVAERKLLPAGS